MAPARGIRERRTAGAARAAEPVRVLDSEATRSVRGLGRPAGKGTGALPDPTAMIGAVCVGAVGEVGSAARLG